MKRIAVANLKGGVGKSTTTLFVAEHWARRPMRILVLDLDPRSSLSYMLLSRQGLEQQQAQLKTLPHLLADIKNNIEQPALNYIVRFSSDLADLQQNRNPAGFVSILPSVPQLWFNLYDFDRFQFANGRDPVDALAGVLRNFLAQVDTQYDCVLMDCAPGFGSLTRAALMIADKIVAPTIADNTSIRSLGDFVDLGLQKRLALNVADRLRVVISKFTGTNSQKTALDGLKQQYTVIAPPIPMRDQVLAATEMFHGSVRSYGQKYNRPRLSPLSTHVKGLCDALHRDIFRVEH